jgi:hypothetical protein
MHSWRRHTRVLGRLTAPITLAAVALVAAVGSASASAPLRVCPTCTYTDIPAALAAAASQSGHDRIHVGAGSYPDAITVSTDATIMGAGAEQTMIAEVNVDVGVSATIHGVTITGHFTGGPITAPMLRNEGNLTLKQSVVTASERFAPGIFNASTGIMTLQNVMVTRNSRGGGIVNAGDMTVRSSTVTQNFTEVGGGGIVNSGSMTLQGSVVSDNTARFDGGGIANSGTMTVRDSTVSDNVAAIFEGGGIDNAGVLTLASSTVAGNETLVDDGGGIANEGTLTLRDTTVRGNRATFQANQRGGGIYNADTGDAELRSSTVVDNLASIGPGIFNDGGTLTIKDSTIQP